MDLHRKPNGKWELRWREGDRRRARTFVLKGDAVKFEANRVRRKQLGQAAIPEDIRLSEFVETYWRLHAVPNLAPSTREFYKRTWANHIMPRLGDYGVRELTPSRIARFREDLERAGVGTATVVKTMRIVQSILSFAVSEELIEYNAAANVVGSPGASQLPAPTDPGVTVSRHRALLTGLSVRADPPPVGEQAGLSFE